MSAQPTKYKSLIAPADSLLIVINCQTLAKAVDLIAQENFVSVVDLGSVALTGNVPVIFTTLLGEEPSTELFGELIDTENRIQAIPHNRVNPWDGDAFHQAIRDAGRSRLIVTGQCSEVSVTFTVLSGLKEGYEVYIVKDASMGILPRLGHLFSSET